ncbi:hypothetical protein D3C72_1851380 [compost metagenome]
MTAMTTATPGRNSHGAVAIERMFCASRSSTPQEIVGGWRPRPRNESEVSARIIAGTASVTEAMIWLEKLGSIWRKMMRPSGTPSSRAAATNSSVLSDRNRPRTTRASCAQPVRDRIMVIIMY